MSRIRRTSGRGSVGAAAGLAPLALALLLQKAVLPGGPAAETPAPNSPEPVVCAADIEGVQGCHDAYPTGCSPTGKYDGYLNLLKNQLPLPAVRPIKSLAAADFSSLDHNTPPGLSKANHEEFKDPLAKLGEGGIYSVTAYLYYAKESGEESSNCEMSEHDAVDYHIGIGFDPDLAAKAAGKVSSADHKKMQQTSVIVEMTPHYRLEYKNEWSLDALKPAFGRQVRVTGQLLIDNEHNTSKDNCAIPGGSACWRATTWELHPVTRFEVCTDESNACSESSDKWVDLERYQPETKPATK